MLEPYMATAMDDAMAMKANTPRTDPMAAGWEKDDPLVITAEKHPICDCVEFAKTRRIACPSKSGIDKAIEGISATSDSATGMIPLAWMGTEAFMGQRL